MPAKFFLGLRQDTGVLKHISQLSKETEGGKKCNLVCPKCEGGLVAHMGVLRKHFQHKALTTCIGGGETALHKYAKQVIVEASSIVRTAGHTIMYTHAVSEESIDPYCPDVTLSLENGENIYIEVFVSNEVRPIKKDFYSTRKFKSFQIDLSKIIERHKLENLPALTKLILQEPSNREDIWWPSQPIFTESNEPDQHWFFGIGLIVLTFVLGVFGYNQSQKYKPKKSRRKYSRRR
jgi:hypothetical protein